MIKNTLTAYGSVAKAFHWIVALLIVTLLCVGLYMTGMEISPEKLQVYGLHKSFGLTVLALAAARVIWRFSNVQPVLPADFKWHERFAAHASHILLYVFMFLMPLSGWGMSSAAGVPVSFFGWFPVPGLVMPDPMVKDLFKLTHRIAAYGLISMIAVHAGAALWHHFIRKDDILKRMLPGGKNAETR